MLLQRQYPFQVIYLYCDKWQCCSQESWCY